MTDWHPDMNIENAIAGARILKERLEHDGPTPGSRFDWDKAVAGLQKLIDTLLDDMEDAP